jgi:hypothetical protein
MGEWLEILRGQEFTTAYGEQAVPSLIPVKAGPPSNTAVSAC